MSSGDQEAQLAELVRQVRAGAKYATISDELICRIGARELAARRTLKEAVKATRNKLHQVAGAYQSDRPQYDAWLAQLAAPGTDAAALRAACLDCMAHHASTRERLPILADFYAAILADLPPIRTVLDLACGLNPLAYAWMPLTPTARYQACDIYADLANFLNQFFALPAVAAAITGEAFVCDLVSGPPAQHVDLALALKIIPPLEQIDRQAGRLLLHALDADFVLVSFPALSLGGRDKRMAQNYEQHFRDLIAGERWPIKRYQFPTELAFLIDKRT